VRVIRALLSGDGNGVEGAAFRLAPGTRLRYQLPDGPAPLLIGTWGLATAALAGELADEVKIGGTANPAMIDVMRQRLAPGLALAGARSARTLAEVSGPVHGRQAVAPRPRRDGRRPAQRRSR